MFWRGSLGKQVKGRMLCRIDTVKTCQWRLKDSQAGFASRQWTPLLLSGLAGRISCRSGPPATFPASSPPGPHAWIVKIEHRTLKMHKQFSNNWQPTYCDQEAFPGEPTVCRLRYDRGHSAA